MEGQAGEMEQLLQKLDWVSGHTSEPLSLLPRGPECPVSMWACHLGGLNFNQSKPVPSD